VGLSFLGAADTCDRNLDERANAGLDKVPVVKARVVVTHAHNRRSVVVGRLQKSIIVWNSFSPGRQRGLARIELSVLSLGFQPEIARSKFDFQASN